MKKIVPFNNVLKFKTDVSEITAISLEHTFNKEKDSVSGIFYISGEYKIMNGGIETEPFKFDLPFDIALGNNYDINTLSLDIDDFRYELIDNNKLKVDIDLLLTGDEIMVREEPTKDDNTNPILEDDLLDLKDDNNNNDNDNDNDNSEYVTYRVYRVNAGDTIDSIISKYEITKDDLLDYNDNLDNIKAGDKLVIPVKK